MARESLGSLGTVAMGIVSVGTSGFRNRGCEYNPLSPRGKISLERRDAGIRKLYREVST